MFDRDLASKTLSELEKYSSKRLAILDRAGEVLAKTQNFKLPVGPIKLNPKSKKSIPISLSDKTVGFLFIDEKSDYLKEESKALIDIIKIYLHQQKYAENILSNSKRFDSLLFEYFRTEKRELDDVIISLLCFGVNICETRLALILNIDDPQFLLLDSPNISSEERETKIERTKRQIRSTLNSFYRKHQNNIVSYLGNNEFLILKDMNDQEQNYNEIFQQGLDSLFYDLKEELRIGITLGVGDYKTSEEGLRESFREAETALVFGKQIWGPGKVYHYNVFGVVGPLFSGVNQENIKGSRDIVRKLEQQPRLLETLKTYFDSNISLFKTAHKLNLHRNTLVYRLDKISQLTGYDPRTFNDAFQLHIALMLNQYNPK